MQTHKKPHTAYASVTASTANVVPDLTFLTGSVGVVNNSPHHHHHHHHDNTASAVMNTDAIADDVMQKVAAELGILNSAELLRLRDRIKLPPT